jgi:hypothetical protein
LRKQSRRKLNFEICIRPLSVSLTSGTYDVRTFFCESRITAEEMRDLIRALLPNSEPIAGAAVGLLLVLVQQNIFICAFRLDEI